MNLQMKSYGIFTVARVFLQPAYKNSAGKIEIYKACLSGLFSAQHLYSLFAILCGVFIY